MKEAFLMKSHLSPLSLVRTVEILSSLLEASELIVSGTRPASSLLTDFIFFIFLDPPSTQVLRLEPFKLNIQKQA